MIDHASMIIRSERANDQAAIHDVISAAFGRPAEAVLIKALRKLPAFDPRLSLVAEAAGEIRGHLLFTAIHIEAENDRVDALALAPLAVHPKWQRQGIGFELVRVGLRTCEELGHRLVIVVGDPAYYRRFGFAPAGPFGIRLPFPVPDEAFILKWLGPEPPTPLRGVVHYPAPFFDV